MEGCQSKCNHCIQALLGCSHFQSCAFKSECENGTLALLQRFKGNNFSRAVSVIVFYICFGETKGKYFNQSLGHGTEMSHRNLRSDSVLEHTGYIGTGAILVPGFSTQPYSYVLISQTHPLDMTLSTCTQLLWSTIARPVLSGTCPFKQLYGLGHRAAFQFQGLGNLLIAYDIFM